MFKPRRTNAHYLAFVEVVTFYHQYQREKKHDPDTGEEYIETTLEDIAEANKLMKEILLRKSDELNGATRMRRGGGVSNALLNKHLQALRKFIDYLRQVGRLVLPDLQIKSEETDGKQIQVLTGEEIQLLFKATEQMPDRKLNFSLSCAQVEAIQSRDRAMLGILYGCGLRRTEAVSLDVGDINFDRALLHVRKGKNYKERFVPISKASLKYLQDYVYDHRAELLQGKKSEALFISVKVRRMQGQSMLLRLNYLQQLTENADLIEKEIGLHTLRHSIATHLLQAGMKLESIARFLGHSTLESTQIYTHLSGFEQSREQSFSNIRNYEHVQLSEDELQ